MSETSPLVRSGGSERNTAISESAPWPLPFTAHLLVGKDSPGGCAEATADSRLQAA
jgi:hypothetical protein